MCKVYNDAISLGSRHVIINCKLRVLRGRRFSLLQIGWLACFTYLTAKNTCECYSKLVSNQGTDGFKSSQMDLVMIMNVLPKDSIAHQKREFTDSTWYTHGEVPL